MLRPLEGPAVEPVTLAEAKAHCRISIDDDDDLVDGLIVAARQMVEGELRRALISQRWELTLDGFPAADHWMLWRASPGLRDDSIRLPMPALLSVESITYVDTDGTTQTLDEADYQVITGTPGAIHPAYGTCWPSTRCQPEAVTVSFTAGYGDSADDVPRCVRQALLLYVGHLYEHREAAQEPSVGNGPSILPLGVAALLNPERTGLYS